MADNTIITSNVTSGGAVTVSVNTTGSTTANVVSGGTGGGSGTSDHGSLTGLTDDDHSQYHNDARANTWLATKDSDDISEGASNLFMTTSERSKLTNIEALADVTDATNVDAAGAVMNSDTSTASMSFVVDEDTMTSNSATKVPTQQSVKAYVDANSGGVSDIVDDTTPQLGGDLDLNGHGIDFPTTPNITDVLDEDNMASNSATALATQQSIKAYVDTSVDGVKLAPAVVAASGGDYTTIGAAIAAGETNIFVTNGDYAESSTITITAGDVSIMGESAEGVVVTFSSATTGFNITGLQYHRFANMTLVGHASMTGSMIASSRQYLVCENIKIKDVTGSGGKGISVTANFANIRNCQFTNIDDYAIVGQSTGIRISGCEFEQGATNDNGAIKNPGNRARISENFFTGYTNATDNHCISITNTNWGMTISDNLFDTSVYGLHVGSTGNMKYSTITGNMFNACGSTGQNVYVHASATFDANIFDGNNHDDNLNAYQLLAGDRNIISNCHIKGRLDLGTVNGTGIEINGDYNLVDGCIIQEFTDGVMINSGATGNRIVQLMYGTNTTNYTDSGTSTELVTPSGSSVSDLNDLGDVTLSSPSTGEVLKYNGSAWVNDTDATSGGGGLNPWNADILVATTGGDYTTLKDALENASEGDTIFVANSTTESDVPVSVANNVTIIGVNMHDTVVNWQNNDPSISAQRLHWKNICLSGAGGHNPTYSGHYSSFQNVKFIRSIAGASTTNGITFSGAYMTFDHCWFETDNTSTSQWDFYFSGNGSIVNSSYFEVTASNTTTGTVWLAGNDVTLNGCTIYCDDSSNTGTMVFCNVNTAVKNCTFRQGNRTAVGLETNTNAGNVKIIGNAFTSLDKAIQLEQNNALVVGNFIYDTDNGIEVDGDFNVISGNWVSGRSNAAGVGIEVQASENDNIISNNFIASFATGIEINSGATGNKLVSNNTDNIGTTAILDNGTNTDYENPVQVKTISIEDPTDSEDITIFRTDKAITVQELNAVLVGSSTPSVTFSIKHSTDRSAAGNALITSPSATTNTTTGTTTTSFDDATIPADSWVWLETTAQSGTVDLLSVDLRYTED